MLRLLVCLAVAFCLLASPAVAADAEKKKKKKKEAAAATAVTGTVLKVDADAGTVTVRVPGVKKKDAAQEKDYKVTQATAVTAVEGENKTELKADKVADLLKKDAFKVGTTASVQPGDDGTAKSITLGGAAPAAKKKKKAAK